MPDFPSFSPEFEACLGEGAGVYSLVSLWQEGCAAAAGCRVSRSWIFSDSVPYPPHASPLWCFLYHAGGYSHSP